MSGDLAGKVAVITGGGRGLGLGIARLFGRHGATLVLLDRDGGLLDEAVAALGDEAITAQPIVVDITDEAAVIAAAERIHRDHDRVDVLVNNAGIGRLGPSMSFSRQDWHDSFEVMGTGVFLCSREFGRLLRAGGGGTIVNISSINGLSAFPMRLAYSAAKAAVVSMTQVLATEWSGYGIRVNAVAPGMIQTDMLQSAIDDGLIDADAYLDHTPLRRFAVPEDIAEVVLFLASDRSRYVTGQVVVADGGWTAFGWVPWSGDPDAPGVARGVERSA